MKNRIYSIATSPMFSVVFRLVLGAIFLYAGVEKACDTLGFAQAIDNYQILPDNLSLLLATTLPWIEIAVAISLILGIYARLGSLVATLLLGVFSCALVISLIRGLDISCGCFGNSPASLKINWSFLFRDLALFAMGLHIYYFDQKILSIEKLLKQK
jgi:uncharacterized membrane protein YphA (DoxX/SURF4 family)